MSCTVLHTTHCTVNMLHHVIQSITTKNRPRCSGQRAVLWMLRITGVLSALVCEIWSFYPVIPSCWWKGWMLTYIDVCSPYPPPLSSRLHSCRCYVMCVCYETLHWKTRVHWSVSSEHKHTHIRAPGNCFHPLFVCEQMQMLSSERTKVSACNTLQYVSAYYKLIECIDVNLSAIVRLWKCAELLNELFSMFAVENVRVK